MERWITDDTPSERFPYYTRANADEVGPEPFSPLGWSLGWERGCIPGVAEGFVRMGVVRPDELRSEPWPEVFGNWGGYFYNQLSLPRLMGVRMPGASPDAIDNAYFGDHPGVPPYEPQDWHEDEVQSAKLAAKMGWAMTTESLPEQEAAAEMARQLRASRPVFAEMDDAALVAHARLCAGPLLRHVWRYYCEIALAASLGPGAVQAVCAGLGRPEDAVTLLAAVGDIESADSGMRVWDLSRKVARSAELTAAFDAGVEGVLERIAASDTAEARDFAVMFASLLEHHGHRGPNEWDMRAHSWDTRPSLVLGMIDAVRRQSDDRSPYVAATRAAAAREALLGRLTELTAGDPETQGTLLAGLHSAGVFMRGRELGKNACIRCINEAKLAMFEVGARMAARGAIDDVQQVFMLLDGELDSFLADPAAWRATILERDAQFAVLATLEPPYIVKQQDGVPPIDQWPVRGRKDVPVAAAGDVLQGAAGAPGAFTGRARIVLHPDQIDDLDAGDVMVAPTTDPSWTPLFLSVGAVVCNVGAVNSHAAIVCRELGVPCAVSVLDATDRIPEGATITVDGSSGTVAVVAVP